MKRINYKSDFDFILRLLTCAADGKNEDVGWPDYDWTAIFYTSSKANSYTASCIGGVCANCFNDNGQIHVVFNSHRLGAGILQMEFKAELPDGIYPDTERRIVVPMPLDIELVRGCAPCPTAAEIEATLPYIKGDKGEPFTYDDLTEAQKTELQRPATEAAESVSKLEAKVSQAAESVSKLEAKVSQAEALRKDAEQTRISNENSRTSAENDRVRDENIRKANETSRQSDETSRQSNETARVEAETARAEEFATWENEIDSKADRTELSNVLAESTDDGVILKERGTGEVMYPQTLASLVHTSDGGNVDEGLEKAKFKVFVDMWNQAWKVNGVEYGRYDPENAPDAEHPFMGNDIWMTYEEALAVLSVPVKNGEELQRCYAYTTLRPRTNICFVESLNYTDYDLSFFATGQTELETARITHNSNGIRCKTATIMFSGCIKLTDVFGIMIDLSKSVWTNTFHHCYRLKEVRIKGLLHDISFEDSPPLSYESISYLVANAANTGPITITVHADVYAKLTGESNTEWHQVLLDAAEKQITFATT